MAADASYPTRVHTRQDGCEYVPSGAFIDFEAGSELRIAGTNVATALATAPAAVAAGYKIARGQHTTVAASDTVVTGLAAVVSVTVSFDDAPVEGAKFVSATIGDQAGTPAAGSILIKTHKDTDADAAIVDATTFTIKVNWIAIGT